MCFRHRFFSEIGGIIVVLAAMGAAASTGFIVTLAQRHK
jgi:hypothetical protein